MKGIDSKAPWSNPEKSKGTKLVNSETVKDSGNKLTVFSVQYIVSQEGGKMKNTWFENIGILFVLRVKRAKAYPDDPKF